MKLSLVAARDAFGEGDFNAALMNYYGILNWLIPSKRAKYFKEFCDALQGLLSDESIENQQKIVWLKMSCELFEQKPTLLNKCAEFFFSIGTFGEWMILPSAFHVYTPKALRITFTNAFSKKNYCYEGNPNQQ
ncbi:unnamed protein product [Anisakis simplex]|uniref:Tetratricopeptide repeat protein n=1 Tax=Anisakis simplex TaxID=6269 RepID=A0A0M3JAN0_ANISI|nr:unnamed protein product [Anisakis simplex]